MVQHRRYRALLQKKRYGEAIAYFNDEGSEGFLGLDYALMGKRDEAEALRKSAKFPNHLALICAGLGAAGTPAAARALAHNWNEYRRRFGDRDFALVFRTSSKVAAISSFSETDYVVLGQQSRLRRALARLTPC